nr:diguanylate cyclase [Clostridium yunnanense]
MISAISLGTQLRKEYDHLKANPYTHQLTFGFLTGLLSIALMYFGFIIYNGSVIDFRNIAIMIAVIHGGGISLYVCSIMTAVFRIIYFGVNVGSIYGVILTIITSIGCWVIASNRLRDWQKWTYCTLFNTVAASIVLVINHFYREDFKFILSIFIIASTVVSAITFSYLEYCFMMNKLYVRLVKESTQDFLTGVNNVRQFYKVLKQLAANAVDKDEKLSILVIDIDNFKGVNDTYGHNNGDIVLKEVASILKASSRSFDVISRNGGEEFTVILLDCGKDNAIKIAEKIRTNIEKHSFILSNEHEIYVTVSIGTASFPESTGDIKRLYELADEALYESKKTGKNKVSHV